MTTSNKLNEFNTILKDEMFISSYQVDKMGYLNIPAIGSILEELAWRHADSGNFGFDALSKQNMLWVLSRLSVKIIQRPKWRDKVIIKTWSCGPDGIFARREFQFEDLRGNVLLTAVSHWLILDGDTHRMIRLNRMMDLFPEHAPVEHDFSPIKVDTVQADYNGEYERVRYSDIDLNKHMNNTKYMQRLIDSYDEEIIDKYRISSFEVNYLNEAVFGDRLKVVRQDPENSEQRTTIIRESDQKEMARIQFNWEERKRGHC